VDVLGLVVGALLGTFVMTAVMETAQAARITRISIPFTLAAVVSERRATIRVAGFATHLLNGLSSTRGSTVTSNASPSPEPVASVPPFDAVQERGLCGLDLHARLAQVEPGDTIDLRELPDTS
jgi:hypothetical protein